MLAHTGFDAARVVELVRREKVSLRGLDRRDNEDATVITLSVKLPPRYPAERLLDALGRLEGVREVEWHH
jgi:hypothetical protein